MTGAILVLAATLAFVLSPALSSGFGGFAEGAFPVPQDDPPAQPAGWAFSIWGVIYLWLLISAGAGVVLRARDTAWEAARLPLILSLAPGAVWIAVALTSPEVATALLIWMLAAALWAHWRTPAQDRWWLAAPVALYAGWLTAAAWVSLAIVLAGHGVIGGAASAILALVGALGTGLAVLARRAVAEYALALAWAFAGLAAGNLAGAPLLALAAALAAAGMLWQGVRAMRMGAGA